MIARLTCTGHVTTALTRDTSEMISDARVCSPKIAFPLLFLGAKTNVMSRVLLLVHLFALLIATVKSTTLLLDSPHCCSMISLSQKHIDYLNKSLMRLSAPEILTWAAVTFPNLYQTTAFGLTGLVIMDMISKTQPVDLIFIDTLHHFPQTYELVDKVREKYNPKLHIYRPAGVSSEQEFAAKHGDSLWESNDSLYDYLVKVEPAQRAYKELAVNAVLTGRRKLQGASRSALPVIEYEASSGILKINPLWDWDFARVKNYIEENDVPYNELLDLGYKSVGDWHLTVPVADGEDERLGRWKGKAKTECGIHETSRFAKYLQASATSS